MAAKDKSNEIHITRIYDAPVKAVWEAWTDPEQVAKWWGPRGFTLTTHGKDLRAGGHWSYTMHGPDGVDYPNKTIYFEVEKYKKLVYDHGGSDDRPPLFRVTVLFSESGGKTKMEMSMALPTPEAAAETRKFIKQAGGDSTWDRLAEYLERESSGKERFVINRSFAAPLELMFRMWTDPEHVARWLPPTGRIEYLEIDKPDRLVYTQQFCEENGKTSRHPMLTTVRLSAEGPDQTRVTITCDPSGSTTGEEMDTFVKSKAGMARGWTGSFDNLEAYLTTL
jgi:uncharacterized protein YndB with AHSA1/START domain